MADGKLDLKKDLKFGTLNPLEDVNVSNSGDRRRTDSLTALNSSIAQTYGKDTLRLRQRFNGIVVHKKQVQTPRYQNKASLLQAFIATAPLEGAATETSAPGPGNTTGNLKPYSGQPYTIYKVYIPELEPRPAPKSFTDPTLHTYPDIMVSPGRPDLNGLPLGAIVQVIFEDPNRLYNPQIVDGDKDKFVYMAGYDVEQANLELMFAGGQPGLLGDSSGPVTEQEITGIPNIKKSTTNKNSDSYTHWGNDPAMKKLLVALNSGAAEAGATLTISSALRTPYNQVRIMFQNYKRKGGLDDRAKGRAYLVGLYNDAAANAIVDAFEQGNYQTEQQAGAGAGHLAAPESPHYHISKHQLGKAVDVSFGGNPTPNEKVAKALLAAAKENKGINVLMEKDHFHVSYEGDAAQSKFRRYSGTGGPTDAQMASVAAFGLTVGPIV